MLTRSDGTTQLTSNGKSLYTFTEDSAGTVRGDRFSDDFDGHHVTWHVVRAPGATANGPSAHCNGTSSGAAESPSNNQPPSTYPGY